HAANVGRRPHQYYEDLSRLPGLALIDATEPRFNYVANAALVVTENGPAGWEGLLLGRPVLALADNFYQGTGMVRRLRNPEDLSATVLELLAPALAGDAADGSQPLGWMLDAEWETTVPVEESAAALALLRKLLKRLVETSDVSRARAEAVS